MFMRLGTAKQLAIQVVIAASTTNYNLKAAIGNPSGAVNVVLTINSGVVVYSTSTATPAVDLSGFAAGSTVMLINNGSIFGMGGNGGAGALSGYNNATGGGAGGPALKLGTGATYIINNTSGYIFGGGGGGGGGSTSITEYPNGKGGVDAYAGGGGGGGGGQSYAATSGGGGGPSIYSGPPGTGGANGNNTGPGGGGSPNGGAGGGWGAAGGDGGSQSGYAYYGASGGAAGKAISVNSATYSITGGNNGTQIKGAVS